MISEKVRKVEGLQPDALVNIIKGLYAGKHLTGKDGLLTGLIKDLTQIALQAEMDKHLADTGDNRRNGLSKKTVKGTGGTFELDTPRDRECSFEPQLVKKRQTVLTDELDSKILTLYASGNSYDDISSCIADMYGADVSPGTISAVTDKLIPELNAWKTRTLEDLYTVIFMDGMYVKTRQDSKVSTRVIYNVMGINQSGHKEILGFYTSESEGAQFWLSVLSDLQSRGVKDILVACIDGLKGFPEAIGSIFPHTTVQLCIVHQIRYSLKLVASKNQKEFMTDLKRVYQASSLEAAEAALRELEAKWKEKYPLAIKSWINNWAHLSNYFGFSQEVRRLIYTTNPIEGFHRQLRKYTKTKGAFTSENALQKLIYCAIMKISQKWAKPMPNWSLIISQLDICFPNRLTLGSR
jgi:transposase-like protein